MKTKLMILLCLICVLFITGCGIKEEAPSVVDGYWKYTLLEDGTYSVGAANKNDIPSRIEIPREYDGIAVTAITVNGFARCSGLRTVVIPDHFETIGEGAFYICENLQTVYIPNSVKSIDQGAIGVCNSKQTVTIYYDGTAAEWKRIFKAGNWADGTKCQIVCTDQSIDYDQSF